MAVYEYASALELTERNPFKKMARCKLNAAEVVLGAEDAASVTGVRPGDVLSTDEVRRLLAAARPGFYRTFFLTAVLTGARVGELTGLVWNDVDLEAGTLAIRRSVSWAKARGTTGRAKPRLYQPKTTNSRRTIQLPVELVSALRRWKLACPPSTQDLVFPNADGTPRHRSTIAADGLRPALKRAGLRHVTIHSLRHTFASGLIMQGRPVTEVAHLLGHASPAITLSVYSHWFRDTKSETVTDWAKAVCGGEITLTA
jgi:integrase